jgi:hypothetical protein
LSLFFSLRFLRTRRFDYFIGERNRVERGVGFAG